MPKITRSVIGTAPDGTETVYPSLRAAAKAYQTVEGAIGNACAGRIKSCKGLTWRYADPRPEKRRVYAVDMAGHLAIYDSVAKAAAAVYGTPNVIYRALAGKQKYAYERAWRWGE